MLNPTLFALISRCFGANNTCIVNEDLPMTADYAVRLDECAVEKDGKAKTQHKKLNVLDSGEEYRVSCPFCSDTRKRLYINHRWGVFDPETRSCNKWLAHCWNNECLSEYANRVQLYDMILGTADLYMSHLSRPQMNKASQRLSSKELPGPVIPIGTLKRTSPSHPAITYLEDRLIDVNYIGHVFDVSFCLDSQNEYARNRIIAPVRWRGELVGWQARMIGPAESKAVPKWYTCPGMRTGLTMYNAERALTHQTKIIVEGPGDVWNFGPQAMGLFTKAMGAEQEKLLLRHCSADDVVVILLDPDQDEKALAERKEHHIAKLYRQLESTVLRGRVVPVYLPTRTDPGELDREYMRGLIRHEAAKRGLRVSFSVKGSSCKSTH